MQVKSKMYSDITTGNKSEAMLTILFPTRTMNDRPAHMRCS